ncbi:MAG: GNAT family N-acetyltransferase [Propionivibrio sp.]
MAAVSVYPMIEYADAVPRIAAWFHKEWRSLYGDETQASVQKRIETWLTRRQIPTAFVAVSDDQVVATVALKENELAKLPHSPWLAGLFVLPEFRRQGIGTLLAETAEREAVSLGVERLWLCTAATQPFYARLGWSVAEHCQLPSGAIVVMSKRL